MGVLFLGAPGSGKGTQAQMLSKECGFVHISTGDILREEVQNMTELGKKAKAFMDEGKLVPDELLLELVSSRIKKAEKGYVLDGYPRNLNQAIALDNIVKELQKPLNYALFLDVPEEELITRLTLRRLCPTCNTIYHLKYFPPQKENTCDKCGSQLYQREDDTREVVLKRLEVYNNLTKPLIEFYEEKNILRHIVGLGSAEEIKNQILVILKCHVQE
ncbi:MAG: adenylate kinase [Thermoanaerobaculia bacterium]